MPFAPLPRMARARGPVNPRDDDEQPPPHTDADLPYDPLDLRPERVTMHLGPTPIVGPAKPGVFIVATSGKAAHWTGSQWEDVHRGALANLLVTQYKFAVEELRWKVPELPFVSGLVFDPKRNDAVFERDGRRWLNTFRGLKQLGPAGDHDAITLLIGHLFDGDQAAIDWFLDWVATMLQSLHTGKGPKRIRVAVVLHGVQGSGKGLLTLVLRAILGDIYVRIIGQDALEDSFTLDGLDRVFLLVANEVVSNSNRGDERLANRLKAWVTDHVADVRAMHQASAEREIHFNTLITSNDDRPVRVEEGDRRFTVVRQDRKLDPSLAKIVADDIETDQRMCLAFGHAMLQRTITNDVSVPFDNADRRALMKASGTAYQVFVEELLEVGIDVLAESWIREARGKERWASGETVTSADVEPWCTVKGETFVPSTYMSEIFQRFCAARGYTLKGKPEMALAAAFKKTDIRTRHTGTYRRRPTKGYLGVPRSVFDPPLAELAEPGKVTPMYGRNWNRVEPSSESG